MTIQEVYTDVRDIIAIEELIEESARMYEVSCFDKVLLPMIQAHDVLVVAGGYFGDEGKGKITAAIANNDLIKLIVRVNSGENAGHTVYHDGKKYVFNLTPSGILVPGKINGIGPECVMDPVSFMEKEMVQLTKAGIDYKDKLFVGNVHIVGPHHKILDFALNPPNSSTLMGMSYVHSSKVMKKGLRLDLLFNSKDEQRKELRKEINIYNSLIKSHGIVESEIWDSVEKFVAEGTKRTVSFFLDFIKSKDKVSYITRLEEKKIVKGLEELAAEGTRKVPNHMFDFLKAKNKVDYLIDLYEEKVVNNPDFPKRVDVARLLRDTLKKGEKVLIESPQSYNLSNATEKHWSSSTSAQTHAAGVKASALYNTEKYKSKTINVFKTPADSRVGIGANPASFVPQDYFSKKKINSLDKLKGCVDFDKIQKLYFESIQENGILNPVTYKDGDEEYLINEAMAIASSRQFGEKGATTGKPRITGVFDCLSAAIVNDVQGPSASLSALDRGDYQDYVGLTVGYVYHNPDGKFSDSNGIKYNNGDIIRIGDPYPCDQVLKHCYGITKVMPGWKNTPIGVGKRNPNDPLPENVQRFIGSVEEFTGLEVVSIGNGQNTEDLIYIKQKN